MLSRRREAVLSAGLVVASILTGLVALELGCRLLKGPRWLWHWPNLARVLDDEAKRDSEGWAIYDPFLGYIPRPNSRTEYGTFDEMGLRIDPSAPTPLTSGPILATGGSLTLGDEVADPETWPAMLQRHLRMPVINAGGSGYGIDQAVLRAELVAVRTQPTALIVSFTSDNLWRNEMRRLWGVGKPYLIAQPDGTLTTGNVPVPTSHDLPFLQRMFGWSVLIDVLVDRLDASGTPWRSEWRAGNERALPQGAGLDVACTLMRRLAALEIPVLVVAQYEPAAWRAEGRQAEQRQENQQVLDCARRAKLGAIDTFDMLDRKVKRDGLYSIFLVEHHNATGNALIAEAIAEVLAGLLPPRPMR